MYTYKTRDGDRPADVRTVEQTPVYQARGFDVKRKYNAETNRYTAQLYAHNWLCLDTETSHRDDVDGWVYQWAVGYNNEEFVTIGRDVWELCNFLKRISDTSGGSMVVCYIHNLSYDLSYMMRPLMHLFGVVEPFYTQPHKALTCRFGNIELRCSYKMSNNSLAGWCKALNTYCIKAVGEIDYNVVRFPDSELTEEDWNYQISDIFSMRECIRKTMEGYTIANVPLTRTGFVRNDCRSASKAAHWHKNFQKHAINKEVYRYMELAFAGGYTHGNRYRAEETIENVVCFDRTSSYPTEIDSGLFPSKAFQLWGDLDGLDEYESLKAKGWGLLMTVTFTKINLKHYITMPYISTSKCITLSRDYLDDNGRLLKASGVTIPCIDVDLDIMLKQYTYDSIKIEAVYYSPLKPLPEWFRETNRKYFTLKCTIDPDSDPKGYSNAKGDLNGQYGMTATSLVHVPITTDETTGEVDIGFIDYDETLEKYFHSHNNFMVYSWALYVTAYARRALLDVCELFGWDHVFYCDTDSVFTDLPLEEAQRLIDEYNKPWSVKAKQNSVSMLNVKGKLKELGIFELDKVCRKFRYIRSKCYAYEDNNGDLKVTIAGVTKKWRSDPGKTNGDELGNIDRLQVGFTFYECGGTAAKYTYNDTWKTIQGHRVYIGNSCIIVPVVYTISNTPDIDPKTGLPIMWWNAERIGLPELSYI